jgi:hypothetical protein
VDERPQAILHVEPHAIPRLREAVAEAAAQVETLIIQVRDSAYIHEPWMGDPVSYAIARLYNGRFASGPNSPYELLVAYGSELARTRDTLAEMEDRYRRTEGDNAELWGRMA